MLLDGGRVAQAGVTGLVAAVEVVDSAAAGAEAVVRQEEAQSLAGAGAAVRQAEAQRLEVEAQSLEVEEVGS